MFTESVCLISWARSRCQGLIAEEGMAGKEDWTEQAAVLAHTRLSASINELIDLDFRARARNSYCGSSGYFSDSEFPVLTTGVHHYAYPGFSLWRSLG